MIRNQTEYEGAVQRVKEEKQRLAQYESDLKKEGLQADEISRLLDPMRSFHAQLVEEVESYDRLKRGQFDELRNFQGVGQLLVSLRIFLGISQRELADRLGCNESQVSRDERNEYHNIQVERLDRILQALGIQERGVVIRTTVEVNPEPEEALEPELVGV